MKIFSVVEWALLVALAFLPIVDLCFYEPDEGRYAEIAREMMISGDYLTPRFHGEAHLNKPPLAYWGAALGMQVFGVNSFGARFVPACLYLAMITCIAQLGRLLFDRRRGRLAALMFALSPLGFILGHFLSADLFVTAFQVAAVTCAVAAWKEGAQKWVWMLWVCLGLAFLSKGPPGLLCLIPILILHFRCEKKQRRLFAWGPILLGLLVALSWYIVQIISDSEMLRYFVVEEVYERIFTAKHNRERTRWIFVLVLTAGVLPWLFGYYRVMRAMKRWWQQAERPWRNEWVLLAAWFFIPLIIFMLARSRLPFYVAPQIVPLLIAFAALAPQNRWSNKQNFMGVTALAIVFLVSHQILRQEEYGEACQNLARQVEAQHDGPLTIVNASAKKMGGLGLAFDSAQPVRFIPHKVMLKAQTLADLQGYLTSGQANLIVVKTKFIPHYPSFPGTGIREGKLTAFLIGDFKPR